ncbi:hypothetical protein [Maledivibacter halophilus]|uniref:Uncharacterized protein n=1 Tax=Maledivibacter halophilus TaxID=36842 RepID=A0A1T5M2J6_9FIRM|nr:hypothetical protein [Maledivibacter halophilus]SKC82079.1 hypothetical protein SAMN02194393_03704 [Maledivibacter halophilus]
MKNERKNEGTLRQALGKTKYDRGIIIDMVMSVRYIDGTLKEETIKLITEGINAIVWNDVAVEAFYSKMKELPSIEEIWDGQEKPAIICVTDDKMYGLCFDKERPEVKTVKIKVLYPDGSGKETEICCDNNSIIAMAWTDDTIDVLRKALVSPDRDQYFQKIWNDPVDWKNRNTLITFISDGNVRACCKCLNCEMEGACVCGGC